MATLQNARIIQAVIRAETNGKAEGKLLRKVGMVLVKRNLASMRSRCILHNTAAECDALAKGLEAQAEATCAAKQLPARQAQGVVEYLVVAGRSVVLRTPSLDAAKAKLNEYPAGAFWPERMVAGAMDGKVLKDPHTIGEGDQLQRLGNKAGFNKWWWNWSGINAMNAIAQAALDDLPQGTRVEVIGPSVQCGTALADGTPTVGITTAAACKAAAAAVGLTYQKAVDAHDRPAGCWKDPNTRVYFNAQASPTSPWSRPRALCTLGATPGEEEYTCVLSLPIKMEAKHDRGPVCTGVHCPKPALRRNAQMVSHVSSGGCGSGIEHQACAGRLRARVSRVERAGAGAARTSRRCRANISAETTCFMACERPPWRLRCASSRCLGYIG